MESAFLARIHKARRRVERILGCFFLFGSTQACTSYQSCKLTAVSTSFSQRKTASGASGMDVDGTVGRLGLRKPGPSLWDILLLGVRQRVKMTTLVVVFGCATWGKALGRSGRPRRPCGTPPLGWVSSSNPRWPNFWS